jgi:serine/threonine-protein kinase RsbW
MSYEVMVAFHQPVQLTLRLPAVPTRLAGARAQLRQWLTETGINAEVIGRVLVAVGEACANAIEHGYRLDPAGEVTVEAVYLGGTLTITVSDTGTWRSPESAPDLGRGHGMDIIAQFMDEVSVTSTGQGTSVVMVLRGA